MTTEQIHGHEIMALVAESPAGLSLAELTEKVTRKYGAEARFHTCSAENMSFDELLVFLGERDKIQLLDGRVLPGGAPACNHD